MNKKGFLKELILGVFIIMIISGGILYIEMKNINETSLTKLNIIISMIMIASVRLNISFIMSKMKKSC